MTPILVTPPATPVVALGDMKAHLRVDFADDDALIEAMEASAVAYLDGWKGVLGRPMLEQVWAQEFDGWGDLRLAMPDVSAVTVTGYDTDDAVVAATESDLKVDSLGPYVVTDGPAVARVVVQYTCAMAATLLPSAQMIVKLIVGHWYANREAVSANGLTEVPMAAQSLISAMRWRGV